EVASEKLFEPGPSSIRRALPSNAPPPSPSSIMRANAARAAPQDSATPPVAGPLAIPQAFGAWDGDSLVGVAAVCARWLRLLAVVPRARRRGAGSALLAACELAARTAATSSVTLRTLDQPGNYLAPGIDERNTETIAWLERRGWRRHGDPRTNVLI